VLFLERMWNAYLESKTKRVWKRRTISVHRLRTNKESLTTMAHGAGKISLSVGEVRATSTRKGSDGIGRGRGRRDRGKPGRTTG